MKIIHPCFVILGAWSSKQNSSILRIFYVKHRRHREALVPRNGFSVPVKVSTDGEDESIVDSNVFYTYFNQIQLISLNPTSAFVGGNSTVVVVGESFIDTSFLTCYFGMHQVRATYVSSTEVKCNVPPISPGNYKVSVSLNGLYADKSSVGFAFNIFAKPIMSSIYPNRLLVQQKAVFYCEEVILLK